MISEPETPPEEHPCQYCRHLDPGYTVISPAGKKSYICPACFLQMARRGRELRPAAAAAV